MSILRALKVQSSIYEYAGFSISLTVSVFAFLSASLFGCSVCVSGYGSASALIVCVSLYVRTLPLLWMSVDSLCLFVLLLDSHHHHA